MSKGIEQRGLLYELVLKYERDEIIVMRYVEPYLNYYFIAKLKIKVYLKFVYKLRLRKR